METLKKGYQKYQEIFILVQWTFVSVKMKNRLSLLKIKKKNGSI